MTVYHNGAASQLVPAHCLLGKYAASMNPPALLPSSLDSYAGGDASSSLSRMYSVGLATATAIGTGTGTGNLPIPTNSVLPPALYTGTLPSHSTNVSSLPRTCPSPSVRESVPVPLKCANLSTFRSSACFLALRRRKTKRSVARKRTMTIVMRPCETLAPMERRGKECVCVWLEKARGKGDMVTSMDV